VKLTRRKAIRQGAMPALALQLRASEKPRPPSRTLALPSHAGPRVERRTGPSLAGVLLLAAAARARLVRVAVGDRRLAGGDAAAPALWVCQLTMMLGST
jgi:hypothetical protein